MYFSTNVLTNFIIHHYFNESNCLLILTNKMNPFHYKGELSYVVINIDGCEIPHHVIFNYYGCQGVIVIHENSAAIFELLEVEMKLRRDRFNYRKYLFLPMMNQSKDMLDVFESPAVKYVTDILAVKLNSTKYLGTFGNEECIFDMYTHKYVGSEIVSNNIVWLDRWYSANESFLLNRNLYPDKLKDQSGRSFRIATFTYKPYSILNPPDGTDLLIALEYTKRHNMTPVLIVDEESQWGEAFNNWTGYGIMGNVVEDKADIGVGALYIWEREYGFFDYSKPVMRSGVTCIVKAPRLASDLTTPFLSFSKEMWLMTATSYIYISSSIFLAIILLAKMKNRHINIRERLLASFAMSGKIFLVQSHQAILNQKNSRVIFGTAMVLGLFLTAAYCGGFASITAIPRYYNTIRDINDFVATNMKWGATSTTWITSLDLDKEFVYKKVVSTFVVKNEEDLAKMNDDEDFAYAIERLQAGNFAIGGYVTLKGVQKRRILDKDIYWNYCILMMRKNSILLPSLNDVVNAVTESGLIYFWESQVVIRHMDVITQKAVKDSSLTTKPGAIKTKLALRHVEGIFVIWTVGLSISTLTFLGELLMKKLSKD